MRIATPKTLSLVPISASTGRRRYATTQQTLHTLEFIHRFRHVTPRHVQLSLRHTLITTTNHRLASLRAKGYIARHYNAADRAANRAASYFITLKGLSLLRAQYPEKKYRRVQSVKADATMGQRSRERYHVLAGTYVHFKRHYDGHFEFFTTFDITGYDYMPDPIPDGYVRVSLPEAGTQHYFIEICGWGRSTQQQQRRFAHYLQFAASGQWYSTIREPTPSLFIVTGGQASQRRIGSQMARSLEESAQDDFRAYTTAAAKLDGADPTIWRPIRAA